MSFVLDGKIVSSKISENSDRNEEENPRATGGVGCLRQGGRLSQGLGSRVDAVIGAAGLLHADAGRRGIRRAGDGRLGRGAGGELAARRTRSFGVVGGAELTLPVSSLPDAQAAASDDSSDESARKTRRKAVVERSDESAMLTDDAALFFFSLLMFSTLVLTPFRLGKDFGLELFPNNPFPPCVPKYPFITRLPGCGYLVAAGASQRRPDNVYIFLPFFSHFTTLC